MDWNEITETLEYGLKWYGYDRAYRMKFDGLKPYIEVYDDDMLIAYVFRRNGELVHVNTKR
jgi:hypothetical protein